MLLLAIPPADTRTAFRGHSSVLMRQAFGGVGYDIVDAASALRLEQPHSVSYLDPPRSRMVD